MKDSWLDHFQINQKLSIAPQIYGFLHEAIVLLRFHPGQIIKEKDISERLGFSRTPVREAILRLEDEGLVEIFPQRGTYISKISIEAVYESQFIRETIESATVKNAIKYGTDDLFDEIKRINKEYRDSLRSDDYVKLYQIDEDFHRTIATFCHKKRLWRMINLAKTDMDRVRLLSLKVPQRPFQVIEEHEKIYDSIIKKDENSAEKALKVHLQYIFTEIDNVKKNYPDFITK